MEIVCTPKKLISNSKSFCDEFKIKEADLVGITAFTSNVNRAYEIAKIYKQQGIKVVMGGIHASVLPDEALQFCDAVVMGEVEDIWGKVLNDFESKCLSTKYMGPRIDFDRQGAKPRRDLLHPEYMWNTIQTSRGCPFNCNFCSVSQYLGKDYRQRSAEDVLEEMEEISGEYLFFLDDNLIGHNANNKARANELFVGMINHGFSKKW